MKINKLTGLNKSDRKLLISQRVSDERKLHSDNGYEIDPLHLSACVANSLGCKWDEVLAVMTGYKMIQITWIL